jgi:predicted RNA-binding protein YlxR (DUF448 family)
MKSIVVSQRRSGLSRQTPASARPVRTCIVTRAERSPDEMIRFVMSPDGDAVPDLRRKLPGRGVWVTACATIVNEAIRRRAFDRGFRRTVRADQGLADQLDHLIETDALHLLSLANKAGAVITGSSKIVTALDKRQLIGLVHARDGSLDGARKLNYLFQRRYGESADRLVPANLFTSAQLDLALGRTNVVHAALLAVPASQAFLKRFRRLQGYRDGSAAEAKPLPATESLLANHAVAAQETAPEPSSAAPDRQGIAQGPEDA